MRDRLVRLLRERTELVVLAAILLGTTLLRNPSVPAGISVLGIVESAGIALQAVGIVLVHRTSRIINFAQVELGILGGSLFFEMTRHRTLVRGVQTVCPPCLRGPQTVGDLQGLGLPALDQTLRSLPAGTPTSSTRLSQVPDLVDALPRGSRLPDLAVLGAPGWLVQGGFWLTLLLAIAVVVGASWAIYTLVMRTLRAGAAARRHGGDDRHQPGPGRPHRHPRPAAAGPTDAG